MPCQSNILVDVTGHARITDFGLAMITQDQRSGSTEHGNGARWIAPEILDGRGTYSKEADIFSFAGVTIEVRPRKPAPPYQIMNCRLFTRRFSLVPLRSVTNHLVPLYQ